MLKCLIRYRNAALPLYVGVGEVLRDLDPDLEAWLQRDAPGAFAVLKTSKAVEAPPADRMVKRERAIRKGSETEPGEVMTRDNMRGLVRPKG